MLYYYPNRPILRVPTQEIIQGLEQKGEHIAEKKFNGDNILIYTDDLNHFWNRRKEHLDHYHPSLELKQDLATWPKHCLLNAELMHFKTKNIKNTVIIHAVMVWKDKPLIGKTWGDSRKILNDHEPGKSAQISPVYQSGFWDLFQTADGTTIEGIILKKPSGLLVFATTPINDVPWMLKFRKPCAKYHF